MSMTGTYKTEIVVPQPQLTSCQGNIRGTLCMDIMNRAMAKIAEERKGALGESYMDCQGRSHACIMSIRTPSLPSGIGVDVEPGGQVVFRYDRQGAMAAEATSICGDVARAYATIAILRAQSQLGYNMRVEERIEPDGRVVCLVGVRP